MVLIEEHTEGPSPEIPDAGDASCQIQIQVRISRN
jgi:hypothetical protein